MKWIIRGVIALVLLVVIAVVAVALLIDGIARRGVERGASYALGVPTTLQKAHVGLFSGQFGMTELNVANPPGFDSDHFLVLSEGDVAVSLGSLMGDTVEVGHITFSGLNMNLERKGGKDNAKIILDNLQKLSSGEKQPEKKEEGPAKKYVIREIDIGEITVNLKGYPVAKTVKVAPIKLTNVGSAGEPIDLAYVTGIIMQSIFRSMLAGGIDLPTDLEGVLSLGMQSLGEFGGVDIESLGRASESIDQAGKTISETASKLSGKLPPEAGKAVGDAGKAAEDAANKLSEGIGGLLNKKKDDDKE